MAVEFLHCLIRDGACALTCPSDLYLYEGKKMLSFLPAPEIGGNVSLLFIYVRGKFGMGRCGKLNRSGFGLGLVADTDNF